MLPDNIPTTHAEAIKAMLTEGALNANEAPFGHLAQQTACRKILGATEYRNEICRAGRARWGGTYACICGKHR